MREREIRRTSMEKECRECGHTIIEQRESHLYECERCMGRHEG